MQDKTAWHALKMLLAKRACMQRERSLAESRLRAKCTVWRGKIAGKARQWQSMRLLHSPEQPRGGHSPYTHQLSRLILDFTLGRMRPSSLSPSLERFPLDRRSLRSVIAFFSGPLLGSFLFSCISPLASRRTESLSCRGHYQLLLCSQFCSLSQT